MPEPEMMRFYFLLPAGDGQRLLLRREGDAVTLPFVEVPHDADLLDISLFHRAAREQFGMNATALHSMHCYRKPETHIVTFTLESHMAEWRPPAGCEWHGAEVLQTDLFSSELRKSLVRTWFEERDRPLSAFLPWWNEGWMEQAQEWIAAQLHRLGLTPTAPIEQLKSWYLSAVIRVPTDAGNLYFKAIPPYMTQELPLATALPQWDAEHAPKVLAADETRRWMITADMNGRSLEQLRTVQEWGAALEDYARIQQLTVDHASELPAMHCPDLRLSRLQERAETLLHALPALLEGLPDHLNPVEYERLEAILPKLQDRCIQASAFNLPATLVHGDFHGINVVRSAGRTLFFDWGDACLSHPFFDAMELLAAEDWLPSDEGAYETLRDAYLQQWTEYEPLERLQKLWALSKPLWKLATALGHVKVLEGMEALCPLALRPPYSYAIWSTRQQQYFLAMQIRDLLKLF